MDPINTIINDRYRLERQLGQGGMGIVYQAYDLALERTVAIKLLSKSELGTEGQTRLVREAQMVAKLNHPNIVTVHDVGEADDVPFIVIEHVTGNTLHEKRPERIEEIISFTQQVCRALQHAHENGIIHRDLKPENVMITPDGTAKLMDFGLARPEASRLTKAGTLIGTVFYLAPELASGKELDGRADLYSLGVMLFELTTGELPFTADDPLAVVSQHIHEPAPSPRARNPDLSPELDNLIAKLLSKDPAERPESAAAVLATLRQLGNEGLSTGDSARLEIRTLGGLSIRLGGQPVTGLASRKAEALLVYLAANPRPHPREVLAELLWDELPQRRSMTNLRVALASLRKQLDPFLSISRDNVTIKPNSRIWLDLVELEKHLSIFLEGEGIHSFAIAEQLENAFELYQGDFLEGFFVKKARGFEEWALQERERLHHLVLDALNDAIMFDLNSGTYKRGAAHARRLLQLEPLMESAYRQLMQLLAASGQRAAALAQYESCRKILADELGVEPTEDTHRLYEKIKTGDFDPLSPSPAPEPEVQIPAFVERVEAEIYQAPLFVARERELALLDDYLAQALSGNGTVAFVSGGPGRGKTALLEAFAQRSLTTHPELVVASGSCTALTGAGDPYAPFRSVLGALTGDVEAKWQAGSISRQEALRAWNALPVTAQAILEYGRDLLDWFVHAGRLYTRALAALSPQPGWLQALKDIPSRESHAAGVLVQANIFEQYTKVLSVAAGKYPILVLLDDLQWADSATINLLFHLGNMLQGAPILIIGAYRAEDVALGRSGTRHPLEPVLNEFRRQYGETHIDLAAEKPGEGQAFIAEILESQPNRLPDQFRKKLLRHTGGHPLFTIELVRSLQERGDLIQDEEGQWIEGPQLDWGLLPPQIEGVLEERIGRLQGELRQALTIASVEGQDFTAQVLAEVQQTTERDLVRMLSRELDRRHRLVEERDQRRIRNQSLYRYRFGTFFFNSIFTMGSVNTNGSSCTAKWVRHWRPCMGTNPTRLRPCWRCILSLLITGRKPFRTCSRPATGRENYMHTMNRSGTTGMPSKS